MKLLAINPQRITGSWSGGYTLDRHIKSSEFTGYDDAGRPTFDTVRTEVGEAIYQLKYGSKDRSEAEKLASTAAAFISRLGIRIDVVVPMPASRDRLVQPVGLIAWRLAVQLGVKYAPNAIERTTKGPEMKNVEVAQRQKFLTGAHQIDPTLIAGRNVLLLDDLVQSGATMNAVTSILRSKGRVAKVYALALTRTKR